MNESDALGEDDLGRMEAGAIIIIMIIIIASHEDEMNDKYNDKLCTSNKVISEMSEEI